MTAGKSDDRQTKSSIACPGHPWSAHCPIALGRLSARFLPRYNPSPPWVSQNPSRTELLAPSVSACQPGGQRMPLRRRPRSIVGGSAEAKGRRCRRTRSAVPGSRAALRPMVPLPPNLRRVAMSSLRMILHSLTSVITTPPVRNAQAVQAPADWRAIGAAGLANRARSRPSAPGSIPPRRRGARQFRSPGTCVHGCYIPGESNDGHQGPD